MVTAPAKVLITVDVEFVDMPEGVRKVEIENDIAEFLSQNLDGEIDTEVIVWGTCVDIVPDEESGG